MTRTTSNIITGADN